VWPLPLAAYELPLPSLNALSLPVLSALILLSGEPFQLAVLSLSVLPQLYVLFQASHVQDVLLLLSSNVLLRPYAAFLLLAYELLLPFSNALLFLYALFQASLAQDVSFLLPAFGLLQPCVPALSVQFPLAAYELPLPSSDAL